MKKVTAVILLLTVLFHAGGFYLLFWVLGEQASREMTRRVEAADYSEAETVIVKIPLAIPYNGDSNDYHDISGEIERNGEYLRLVKQKFLRDTLYVVCVRDHRQQQLANVMTDFVKTSSDQPTSPTMKLFGSLVREFVPVNSIEHVISRRELCTITFDTRPYELPCETITVESPPPDVL